MLYNDVILFKEVIEEMGLTLERKPGGITIDGVPAERVLKETNIMKETYSEYFKFVSSYPKPILNERGFYVLNSTWLEAA